MATGYVKVPLCDLRVGARLNAPIYDGRADRNQLLLAEGAELTTGQLDLLQRRGVTQVLIHSGDLSNATGKAADNAPSDKNAGVSRQTSGRSSTSSTNFVLPKTWKKNTKSFLHEIQRPDSLHRDPAVLGRIKESYHTTLTTTRNVFEEFGRDQKVNSSVVACVSEQQLDLVSQDLDLYVSLGVQPVTEGYPCRHSVQTAMLAVSIGTIMGLSREELMDLSSGCLLHDAGMMLVPRRILQQELPLNLSDRLEILKHPLHIANALNPRTDIPHAVKATAYQLHERLNGSGYPRKRQHPQIHLFARIGAVADTYLAMISPRNGRQGLSPYSAIEKLLYATRMGLFDATVVRALLHATSLFPVGSTVTLNDGRTGLVSRSNREQYDRPVIEIISENSDSAAEIVDLTEQEALNIVGSGELVAV